MGHLCDPIYVWTRGHCWTSWMPPILFCNIRCYQKVSFTFVTHICIKYVVLHYFACSLVLDTPQLILHPPPMYQPLIYQTKIMVRSIYIYQVILKTKGFLIIAEICFRRGAGNCYQCYFTWAAALQHQSFGLSVSNNAIEKASIGTECQADYITVSTRCPNKLLLSI